MERTQSPIPQKSCSFSSSFAPRKEKLGDSDRNLSLGLLRLQNTDNDATSETSTTAENNNDQDNNSAETPAGTADAEQEDNNDTQSAAMETATDTPTKTSSITDTLAAATGGDDPGHSDLTSLSEDVDQFLASLRDSPDAAPELPDIAIERFAALLEKEIAKYESGTSRWSHESSAAEDHHPSFLDSVYRAAKLAAALAAFSAEPQYVQSMSLTGAVVHHAMSFLEDELHSLLAANPAPDLTARLRGIAGAMISSGYEMECCQVLSIARRNAMESGLAEQGVEKISIDDVQRMAWESLEGEIASWTKAFRHTITVSCPYERELCSDVFDTHRAIADGIFRNLARGILIQMLNFAEAVSMTKRSAEKLFKVLDMYEALRDMALKLDDIFPLTTSSDSSAATFATAVDFHDDLKVEISSVRSRLGEAAVAMFCNLESSIKSDTGKTPVPGGAVHPLTRYVMNYLRYACEYKNTLEQVFREHQKIDRSTSDSYDDDGTVSASAEGTAESSGRLECGGGRDGGGARNPFAAQLVEVMDLLHSNLEAKSKLYKDLALSNIFMMNNGRYIVQKIKGSAEINRLLGDTWCRKKSSDLRQYHKNYQRETWSRVLGCFKDEGLQVKGSVLKPVLKERFKSFSAMLEEIHKTQSAWIVSDEQLQSELRVSVSAVVVPAYRSFLGRFSQYLDPGRQTEKYIKFGPEDLETYIDELFDGNPLSMIRRK